MQLFVLIAAATALPLLAIIAHNLIRKGDWEGWAIAWSAWTFATVIGIAVGLPDSIVLFVGILPVVSGPLVAIHYVVNATRPMSRSTNDAGSDYDEPIDKDEYNDIMYDWEMRHGGEVDEPSREYAVPGYVQNGRYFVDEFGHRKKL